MSYRLAFKEEALREWRRLDGAVSALFKRKLEERLERPRVESARLRGMKDGYKIKLRRAGYRLVYQVRDRALVVSVVAVGRRERNQVYKAAAIPVANRFSAAMPIPNAR